MLSKKLKLDPKEIPTIARKGKRLAGEYFDIKVWWDNALENPQFAISISTKVDKRATVRNRIKRTMREAIKLNIQNFRPGKYLILIKSPKLAEMKSREVEGLLKKIIKN